MTPKSFIEQLDEQKVLDAIAAAERKSSGEIRIYVSNENIVEPLAAAQTQFARLGMDKTNQRNGVLLYFAPRTQQFALVGDTSINEKCGDGFWREITTAMTALLKNGQFTAAVVEAVNKAGDALARHFPRDPNDANELPDKIVRD